MTPSEFSEHYLAGVRSAKAGFKVNQCPYRTGSQQSVDWVKGWWDGYYGLDLSKALRVLKLNHF